MGTTDAESWGRPGVGILLDSTWLVSRFSYCGCFLELEVSSSLTTYIILQAGDSPPS